MAPQRALALVLLVAGLASCAPPAHAQLELLVDPPVEVSVTMAAWGEPIRPVLDIGTAVATVSVTCTAPGIYTKPVEIVHNVQSDAPHGAGFVVAFNQTVEFPPEECKAETATKTYTVDIDVQFSSQAPAFEDSSFTFVATANTTEGRQSWTETVGFTGTLTARLTDPFREENGTVPIVGEITNTANGAVDVAITVSGAPSHGRLDPTELTVPAASGAAGATRTAFRFDYVPTSKQLDAFTLRFVGRATGDPSMELPPYSLEVTLDPKNEAIYSSGSQEKGSPMLAFPLALAASLAALGLSRRR